MKVSFVLLITLLSVTCLWAYNNVKNNHETVNPKWGNRKSEDSDAHLRTKSRIEVDVDYPGEAWYIKRYGIDYEAEAQAKVSFGWGRSGYYSLSPAANTSYPKYEGRPWFWSLNRKLKDDVFVEVFDPISLLPISTDEVRENLDSCSATATVDQYANPSSGVPAHSSTATAD